MMRYYLSLGSNMGDRFESLKNAVKSLKQYGDIVSMSMV